MFERLSHCLWRRSLVRKVIVLYVVVAMIPLLVLNSFVFTFLVKRQVEEKLHHETRLLELMISEVCERSTQVERVVEMIATSNHVIQFLSNNYDKSYAEMIIELENIMTNEMSVWFSLLGNINATASIYTYDRKIPEKYYSVLWDERLNTEEQQAFLASSKLEMWGKYGRLLPADIKARDESNPMVVPYYRKITHGPTIYVGMIAAAIQPQALLHSFKIEQDDGCLAVYSADEQIYFSGDYRLNGVLNASARHQQHLGNHFYLRMPIGNTGLDVIRMINFGALQGRAMQANMLLLVGLLMAAAVFLALSTQMLRLSLHKLQQTTQLITQAKDNELLVQLPKAGEDEVGQLVDAFNALLVRINTQMEELLSKEKAKQRAQILALQYQLNPHFLFNALHWIQMSMEGSDEYELSDAVASLGKVLRYNLSNQPTATLREEMEHLRLYVAFMNIWKKDSFDFEMSCSEKLDDWRLLRFTLQPLLENAMEHGLIAGKCLHVCVNVWRADKSVVFQVKNNGNTIEPQKLAQIKERIVMCATEGEQQRGVGLVNLSWRLRLTYGTRASLAIESSMGETCCMVKIPYAEEECL